MKKQRSSWNKVSNWYDGIVGTKGHYYHQNIVIPGVLRLLDLGPGDALLDLACGQGVLAKAIPKMVQYHGVDVAPDLIKSAKKSDRNKLHSYRVGDITEDLDLAPDFTHAAIVLALQNVSHPSAALANVSAGLKPGGRVVLAMNHPCFRIPRQSDWGVDDRRQIQYRRVDRYMSPLEIPIRANPSKGSSSATTYSYHRSLSDYASALRENGLQIVDVEEWCSDKVSQGGAAKRENRVRKEIPMFMAILAEKRV